MRTILLILALIAVAMGVAVFPIPRTAEHAVAALPGVGAGWIDTLRRIAGPTAIDTVSPLEFYDLPSDLLGLFERWHVLVSINPHMAAYSRFVRNSTSDWCSNRVDWFGGGPSYRHPLSMANPAGVVAHEFGHRFQFGARPHTVPQKGDTLPSWAFDDNVERFADRFARAMLALRGWDDPDTTDAVLNHRVRYLLLKSYWPVEAAAALSVAGSRPDSLRPRALESGPVPRPPRKAPL